MAHQPLVPARVLRRAVAVGATVAAAFVTHASGAPVPVVPAQSNLTEPGALVRTPDAALWTTSPEFGVCRISPGAKPRPITGTFCGDELRQGPKEPLGMAFDRRSSSFFVADGGSNSGGVWRMHWDPATATIDTAVRIAHLGDDRATGLTLAPTGPIGSDGRHANEVYLTTKGSTAVLRIADSAGWRRRAGDRRSCAGRRCHLPRRPRRRSLHRGEHRARRRRPHLPAAGRRDERRQPPVARLRHHRWR